MYWRYKLFLSILALFLVVGACSGDDIVQQFTPQSQPSASGTGAVAVNAAAGVASFLVNAINQIVVPPSPGPQPSAGGTGAATVNAIAGVSSFMAITINSIILPTPNSIVSSPIGVERALSQGDILPITIPCENEDGQITVEPVGENGFTATVTNCVANNGAVVVTNANISGTILGFGQCPEEPVPLILPNALNATIDGTVSIGEVEFSMINLGMAFTDISYVPSICSIDSFNELVTGVLASTEAAFDFGTSSVSIGVDIDDELNQALVTVDGAMSVETSCFSGSFAISTSEPMVIPEGQTCPISGRVNLGGDLSGEVVFPDDCESLACQLSTASKPSLGAQKTLAQGGLLEPTTIQCEEGSIDFDPVGDTGFTATINNCIENDGTIIANGNITGAILDITTCNDDGNILQLPRALNTTTNGTISIDDVEFSMQNLGMLFTNVTYQPSVCSIASFADKVTGKIGTTDPIEATFDFLTGSVTFNVTIDDPLDQAIITANGNMSVVTPCFSGSFALNTDPINPIRIQEGDTCPSSGTVNLTGGLNGTVTYPGACTDPEPICLPPGL